MGGGPGSRGWVLVAEDDSPSRQATLELLEGAGFRVDVTEDGASALEFLADAGRRDEMPDVLLTDLDMPRVSGAELIAVLRNDPRYTAMAIIVLSSFERAALPAGGVQRMIGKPSRSDTIVRAVAELCARAKSGA